MEAGHNPQPKRSSFVGDAAFAVASSVGTRVLALAAMAVITRQYQAGDYGIWILMLAFAGLAVPLTTMRYEVALVLAPGNPMARRLLWAMLLSTALVAVAVAMGLFLLPNRMLLRLSGLPPEQVRWVIMVPAMLTLMAWQVVLQAWLTREKRFLAINVGALAQVLVASSVTIMGGWLTTPSAAVAVLGGIAGQSAVVILLAMASRRTLLPLLARRPGLPGVGRAMRHYRVYPQYVLPYSISVGLTERFTQVALSAMFSVSFLGAYYAARQIMQAPAQIVASSFRNVLLGHGARHDDLAQTHPYVRGLLTAYTLAIAPMLALGVEWIEVGVTWALGTRWPHIEELAWWCMFPSAILLLTGSLDRLFDLAGRQRLATGLQVASDIVMIATLLAAWRWGLSGTMVVASLSVVQTAYNVVWLAVVLHIAGMGWKITVSQLLLFSAWFLVSFGAQWLLRAYFALPTALGLGVALALISSSAGVLLLVRQRRAVTAQAAPPGTVAG